MSASLKHPDKKIELGLSYLLRGGVYTALGLLAAGMVLNYTSGQSWIPATDLNSLLSGSAEFHSEPPKNLAEFFYGFRDLNSLKFAQAAILLLILLPGLRVAFLLGSFIRKRDWLFSVFAFLVLVFMSIGTLFRITEI